MLAKTVGNRDGDSRWHNGKHEVSLSHEDRVVVHDLEAGALDPLDAGRAAPLNRGRHFRAAFAHPAADRSAHLTGADDGDANRVSRAAHACGFTGSVTLKLMPRERASGLVEVSGPSMPPRSAHSLPP